jgi:hypothetical protein
MNFSERTEDIMEFTPYDDSMNVNRRRPPRHVHRPTILPPDASSHYGNGGGGSSSGRAATGQRGLEAQRAPGMFLFSFFYTLLMNIYVDYLQLTPQDAGATTTMTNGYLNTTIVHRNGNCLTSTRPTTQNSHPNPTRRVTMESVVSAAVAGQQWLDVRQGPGFFLIYIFIYSTNEYLHRRPTTYPHDTGTNTESEGQGQGQETTVTVLLSASETRLCNQTVNNDR